MGPDNDQSDAPITAPSSSISSSQASIVSPFKCFQSQQWWKNAALLSFLYARHCVIPAGLWLVFLAVLLVPGTFLVATFTKTVEVMQLVQAFVVYLVTMFIAVPLLFWCFGAWLVRLTAYAAVFESFSRDEMITANLDKSRVIAAQRKALEHTKTQKGFLAKFWFALTIFLIGPFVVFFVSMMVIVCTSSALLGSSALKLPMWAIVLTGIFCLCSGLATTVPSFVGVCISANVETDPIKEAKNTIVVSVKSFLPLTIITAASVLLSVLISSPHELFQAGQAPMSTLNVDWVSIAQEIWRAVSSTVVWTITLAPMCEYMRGKQIRNG
ncbi:MAG: hypothetical protein JST89_25075 [Cyanobacteria bacterium SZAS-4]|nr:hypothetical protein [Cyanobacteria bacterium SZAS-4]